MHNSLSLIYKTSLLTCIFLFITVAGYSQSNPCGIKAQFTNQKDTIITTDFYQVDFTNISTGATSFKWLYNGLQYYYTPTQPSKFNFAINSSTGVSIHKVELAITNGICVDTASVVVILTGKQPPVTKTNFSSTLSVFSKNFFETYEHSINDFTTTGSGNYLISGNYSTHVGGNEVLKNGFLINLNDSACINWSKRIAPHNSSFNTVKSCKNGDILATANLNGAAQSLLLIRLSSDGHIKWAKTILNLLQSNGSSPVSLFEEDENENIIIAGNTNDYRSLGNSISEQKIFKLNKDGNIIWSKLLRRKYEYPYGTGIIARNILSVGDDIYVSGVLSVDQSYRLESFIIKLNSTTGEEKWSKRYVGNTNTNFLMSSLHWTGNKLLANFNTNSVLGSNAVIPIYSYLDTSGTPLQSYQFNISDFNLTSPYSFKIIPIPSGGFYYTIFGNEVLALQPGYMYYSILAKITPQNNIQWQWKFGNHARDTYKHFALGKDNSLMAVGSGLVSVYKYFPSQNILFTKIDSSGTLDASCNFVKSTYSIGSTSVSNAKFSWLEDSTVSYYSTDKKDLHLNDILILKKWLCPNYIDSCSYISIKGDKRVCDLTKNYTYKISSLGSCSFQFEKPDNVTLVNSTDSSITVSFDSPGIYPLKVNKTNGCSPLFDSILVTAKPLDYTFSLGADTVVCPGTNIKLRAGKNFIKYMWQDGSTDSILNISAPGKYYVTVIDSCNKPVSDTINITLASLAYINTIPDQSICIGDSIILQAKTGYSNYTWSPKEYLSQLDSTKVKVKPLKTETYTVSAIDQSGCTIKDSVRITISSLPVIGLPKDTTVCEGVNLQLIANNNLKSYLWSTGATVSTVSISKSGKYWINVIDQNGCQQRDTITTSFQKIPKFNLGPDTTLCESNILVLKTDTTGSYLWQDNSTKNNLTVTTAGMYWLKISRGSCSFSDSITVNYQAKPKFSFPNDTILCDNATLLIDVSQPSNTASYEWQDGSSTQTYNISKPGKYSVSVKAFGCYTNDTVMIDYQPKPSFISKDTSKCIEDTIHFNVATKGASYLWQDLSQNSFISIPHAGTYTCTVTNFCGTSNATIRVSDIICSCEIVAPNVFSPNGDGINDIFRVTTGCQLSYFDIQIYNREGQIVYKSSNISNGWNGTINGKTIAVGTYYYIIKARGQYDTTLKQKSGSITLLR